MRDFEKSLAIKVLERMKHELVQKRLGGSSLFRTGLCGLLYECSIYALMTTQKSEKILTRAQVMSLLREEAPKFGGKPDDFFWWQSKLVEPRLKTVESVIEKLK